MKFFIQEIVPDNELEIYGTEINELEIYGPDFKHSNVHLDFNEYYAKLQIDIPETNYYLIIYLIKKTEKSIFVAACFEHSFDAFIESLDKEQWETVKETWPNVYDLISNGKNGRFKEGAIIRQEDIEDGDLKWFLVASLGNLEFDHLDKESLGPINDVLVLVLDKSWYVLLETQKSPSALNAAWKCMKVGFYQGLFRAVFDFLATE